MISEKDRLQSLLNRAKVRKSMDKEKVQRVHRNEKVAAEVKEPRNA